MEANNSGATGGNMDIAGMAQGKIDAAKAEGEAQAAGLAARKMDFANAAEAKMDAAGQAKDKMDAAMAEGKAEVAGMAEGGNDTAATSEEASKPRGLLARTFGIFGRRVCSALYHYRNDYENITL